MVGLLRGFCLSTRLALRSPASLRTPLPTPELVVATTPTTTNTPASTHTHTKTKTKTTSLTCAAIILSYNRADALNTTLTRLLEMHKLGLSNLTELIIVDNASSDNTVTMVKALINEYNATSAHHDHPLTIKLIALNSNKTIEGFNVGVQHASTQTVLILDDDARPDPHALTQALTLLAKRPDLGAVTFEPVHPQTHIHEWPFARQLSTPTDRWPVMGCCNLIRRDLWRALGGYESRYQLYRNDMDLAMTILATGMGVHFNPAWTCEHDSPVAARKSPRWFYLATRNWLWLCARHSWGPTRLLASTLGVLHAHKLAGCSPTAHTNIIKGTFAALTHKAPPLPCGVRSKNTTMKHYLHLRRTRSNPHQSKYAP
jgi:GT2 family glycosyltransferase